MNYTDFTFADCGLDIDCNMLQSPVCPCGCGHKASIVAKTDYDIYSMSYSVLEEMECNKCAVLILMQDYRIACVAKIEGEYNTFVCNPDCEPVTLREIMELVEDFQDSFDFHCYGLIVQDEDKHDIYHVIEK